MRAAILALLLMGQESSRLYDPYERPKNGPPLTNIFHKTDAAWLLAKILTPRNHPSARMPEFHFTEEEALDILAYLKSVADPAFPKQEWPAWAAKRFEEMNDDESLAMMELSDRGKAAWGQARCTICHQVNGPGGKLIGGFVDLRVGGIDLQKAGTKLQRDWLYPWLQDPKNYFPDTLMPRYRFSDEEIRGLVEYILRDDAFRPSEEPKPEPAEKWKTLDDLARVSRGKRTIETARCVVCHDVKGIPEVLSLPERKLPARRDDLEGIAFDARCLSCHSLGGRGGTYAPDLTNAGSRLRSAWVGNFVRTPDLIRPLSQQMPKLNLSAAEGKAIAEYFERELRDARIPPEIPGGPVRPEEVERGREAYKTRGCVACHSVDEGPGGVVGPDLRLVGDRLKPGYLWFHLKNPYAVNPNSAEPDYGLSDEEARALAAYLSTKRK